MSTPLLVTLISGSFLIAWTGLLVHEYMRGARYAARFRQYVDYGLDVCAAGVRRYTPTVNSSFTRQFLHYITHRLLTALLGFVRVMEGYIRQAARFNRVKARTAHESTPSSHLTQIAEHKESAQLTEKEKKERKEKALKGE